MEKRIKWHVEKRVVSDLIPYYKNPRIITEDGLKDLKKSFDEVGFAQPININTENVILSGHARVEQLKLENPSQEIDVYVPDRILTPKQEEAIIVRMNKNVAGQWDFDVLANEFEVDDLIDWGFSEDELGMPDVEQLEGITDEDAVPDAPVEPITKRGDVWILGNHRLMCGDSTMIDDVEKLMDGKKADMVFTDPPYGVNFQSQWVKSEKFDVLKNDDSFLDFLPCLEAFSKSNIAWFIWTSHHVYPRWREMYKEYYKSTIIWHKGCGGMGDLKGDYATDFEMALYCTKGRPQFIYNRPAAVWRIGKDASRKYVHPTQKPVELSEYAMGNFLKSGAVVLDLFLGSGSTLIGCEKTNRLCRGMELDEKYCDVIIKRWEDYTGKDAVLESTGEKYKELSSVED